VLVTYFVTNVYNRSKGFLIRRSQVRVLPGVMLRAYPNSRLVMRPSEKCEAKAAQISLYQHAETSKAEAKRKSSTYSVSAG
jgi:hypothetical protein